MLTHIQRHLQHGEPNWRTHKTTCHLRSQSLLPLTLIGRARTWRFVAFCLGVLAMHTTLQRRLLKLAACWVASIFVEQLLLLVCSVAATNTQLVA
jgi:hypothetical protein